VTAWIHRVKFEARAKKGIFTLQRRWIPLPGISSSNRFERMHWERAAVNYTIQGSAAEIMKLALIRLAERGHLPILTVHDEFLFDVPDMKKDGTEYPFIVDIRSIMESVVTLDIPLIAEVGIGQNWDDAKHG
jgi:DNA polymerase-1